MFELPVNEIFDTLQGEASLTGTPATFIRFQFCDVGCPWCDTKHTWALNSINVIPADKMLKKPGDDSDYAVFDAVKLAALIAERAPRHVVITGGEPCHYDLRQLTDLIVAGNKSVQIETSGTREIKASARCWITVSPKIGMPGGYAVRDDALRRAHEIKMPVGKPADIARVIALRDDCIARGVWDANYAPVVWLQPLSQNERATAACVEAATAHGFRVSIQTHKFLGLR